MHDVRLDDPHDTWLEDERSSIARVFESSFLDDDVTPHVGLHAMVLQKPGRHGRFGEARRLFVRFRVIGNSAHVAKHAVQFGTSFVAPTFLGGDPGALLPWRIMTYVLRMRAFEVRDPNAVRVLVEADNLALHGWFVLAGYMP